MRKPKTDHPIKIGKSVKRPFTAKIVVAIALLACALTFFASTYHARAAGGEVTVSASVDRNALNPEDTFTLTISVESNGEVTVGQPTLPQLLDFEMLNEWSGRSQQATMVSTPSGPQFKRVNTVSFNFMLIPKRQGTLNIGAAEVVVDGRVFHTKPISMKVAPGAGAPQRPQGRAQPPGGGAFPPPGMFDDEEDDLFNQLLRRGQPPPSGGSRTLPINPNEAFFVQVDTDKTEAYAGEQVTVSFYIYTRGLIRDLDTLKYPSLKGFWKEDIEIATHLNFQNEVVNGLPYKKALLASYALFPIKEGVATIDPYQVKCSVVTPDMFGGLGFGKPYTFTKTSQPVKIKVKPVPAEGRPADYSGAVGEFQVSARIEDRNIVENQPLTLKVRFEGRGNAKLIEMPPLTLPQGLELYDQQNEARYFRTGQSFKEFRVLLIPRREGDFTIPAIGVSVFDPAQKSFVKKATEPLQVHVGKGSAVKQDSTNLPDEKAKTAAKAENVEPQLVTDLQPRTRLSPATRAVFWILVFTAIGAAFFIKARSEFGWGEKKKDLLRQLAARLRRVEAAGEKGDWRSVGTEMTNTLYFVLGAISGQGGATMELEKLLQKAPPSVRRELAEPLTKQLELYQTLTFAPEAVVAQITKSMDLKKSIGEMESLLIKAVSLGLSAEQSSGSELNPKAF